MKIALFDQHTDKLLPLCYTRPSGDIRVGILTNAEKWELRGHDLSFIAQEHLREIFPLSEARSDCYLDGRALYSPALEQAIIALDDQEALYFQDTIIAFKAESHNLDHARHLKRKELDSVSLIQRPYDVFQMADQEIRADYNALTKGRTSAAIPEGVHCQGSDIFIEEGASIPLASLNSSKGPIYLAKDSEVMEGCMIRGPFALGENSVVKMGAKIYGATSIGPHSKVGGELNNVSIQSHSNKGHDGFLGNAAIGQWCNIGADSNASNLKNNYADVKVWDYSSGRFSPSGLQFCGLIMGDHSKCGINTMFNTGTVVGVSANIFGPGFPRNFIPSFSWGGSGGFSTYALEKSFETASKVMIRRGLELNEAQQNLLKHIFELSSQYRRWENKIQAQE